MIALVSWVIHFAVEQFHTDGNALLFGERRNLGEARDAVGNRGGVIDPRDAIAKHGDEIRHVRAAPRAAAPFPVLLEKHRMVGGSLNPVAMNLSRRLGYPMDTMSPGIGGGGPLVREQQVDRRRIPICRVRRQKSGSDTFAHRANGTPIV